MITKKQALFLAYLLKKAPRSICLKEQPIHSAKNIGRFWKTARYLKTLDLINIKDVNGNARFSLTLKGYFVTPVLIGFGVLKEDKDFNDYRGNAIV